MASRNAYGTGRAQLNLGIASCFTDGLALTPLIVPSSSLNNSPYLYNIDSSSVEMYFMLLQSNCITLSQLQPKNKGRLPFTTTNGSLAS